MHRQLLRTGFVIAAGVATGILALPAGADGERGAESGPRTVRFKGTVKAVDLRTGQFLVPVQQGRDGDPAPRTVDVLVVTARGTRFMAPPTERGAATPARFQDLTPGLTVNVSGTVSRDGSVIAQEVMLFRKAAGAEGESGRRTSPEADAPRRTSPEADAPRRTSPEADAPRRTSPETGRRDGDNPRGQGTRDGDVPRTGTRDGEGRGEGAARDTGRPGVAGERGRRTSPEAGAPPRTSPEADAARRTSPEISRRDGDSPRRPGARDGEMPRSGLRDGDGRREGATRDTGRPGAERQEAGWLAGRVKAIDVQRGTFLMEWRVTEAGGLRPVQGVVAVGANTRLSSAAARREGEGPAPVAFRDLQVGSIVHVRGSETPNGLVASEIRVFPVKGETRRPDAGREGEGRRPAEGEGRRSPEAGRER